MTFEPVPTPAYPTGISRVVPDRDPSVVSVRRSFDEASGDIAWLPFAEDALCNGQDPDLFYPDRGGSVRDAKRICSMCDALERCREWAIPNEQFGVWGGLSELERQRLRSERRRAAGGGAA